MANRSLAWSAGTTILLILSLIFQPGKGVFAQENTLLPSSKEAPSWYMPQPRYPDLLKNIPPLNGTEPEWVKMLYGEEVNIFELERAYNDYYREHVFQKNTHTQNYRYFMRLVSQFHYYKEDGSLYKPTEQEYRAQEEFLKKKHERLRAEETVSRMATWQCIGPFETYSAEGISGTVSKHANIYQFAQSLSNPDIMYCAGEGGGIFKTTDKGLNWTSIGETLGITSPEALEVDPSNPDIVYVSGNNRLEKSTDGGSTWTQIQYIWGLRIYSIAINSANPQIVLTAGNHGLQRSTDGGTTWTTSINDHCWDIALNTSDPDTVYVARKNTTKNITEIWRSADAGQTFSAVTSGWFNPIGGVALKDGGARIGVTDADPNRIYVILLGEEDDAIEDNNFIGIYRSDDAGDTWHTPYDGDGDGNPDNEPGGPYSQDHWCFTSFHPWFAWGGIYDQGFYDLDIAVSDTDPDLFLVGSLSLFKSTDGGVTYEGWGGYYCPTACSGQVRHPDQQDIDINGNDVWVCSDGGIDYYDANFNQIGTRNNGISGAAYWGLGQGWNEDVVTGGRYHNGNGAWHENYPAGVFVNLGGAEAPSGYVNQGENRKVYHSDISGKLLPQSPGQTATNIPNYSMFPNESYIVSQTGELVSDPRSWNVLYLGKDHKLWKSTDGGANFSQVHAFGSNAGDKILGIEVCRSNPDVIYLVQRISGGGKVWKSTDAGTSWTELTLPASTDAMYISADFEDENIIYLALDAYPPDQVFKSTDGGSSWTNISGSALSGEYIKGIQVQGGTSGGVYVVTNKAVYYRNNSMSDWQSYSNGLPEGFDFKAILPFYRDGKIRLATRNRGIWEASLYEPSDPVAQPMASDLEVFCSRDVIQFEDYSVRGNGATWQWSFSPAPQWVSSTTVRNPQVIFGNTGTYSVTLTVTEGGISSSKTINNMITVLAECDPENNPVNAMSLAASGDYMQLPDLNLNTNNITFTAWVKPNGTQNGYSGIIMSDNSSISGMNVRNNNELGFHWEGSQWWWSSGLSLPADEWSHVAMVVTPTGITLYLNGNGATDSYTVPVSQINNMKVGSYQGWNNRNFKGEIDEVCIYDRALSADEVRAYMHLTSPSVNDPDLIHYYQFNRASGLVTDRIDIAHGTLTGNATRTGSTAPIGPGVRNKQTVTTPGQYTFGTTGITLDFPAGGTLPNGDLVATRLDIAPDQNPGANPVPADRYWIIHNFGSNATFTELNSIQFSDLSGINTSNNGSEYELYKRASTASGATWGTAIDHADAATTTSLTFSTGNSITGFSQFAINKGIPLPVELLAFEAKADELHHQVILNWETGVSENSSHFTVERSRDGIHFEALTQIKDKGSDASYQWIDTHPYEGNSYYRLQQVDEDGNSSLSPLRAVFLQTGQSVQLYPNPLSQGKKLHVRAFSEAPLKFELFDAKGRQLLLHTLENNEGIIPLQHLPKGTYFYRITTRTYMTFGKLEITD